MNELISQENSNEKTSNDSESFLAKPSCQKGRAKKPKRNKSAFILFSIEKRALLKSDIKDQLNSNEMMVKLAELWKDLPKSERERYYTEAREDKMRYLKELDSFSKAYPSEIIHNKTKKNHVKKPCSAYAIFLKENKAIIKKQNSELKMADVLKIVSEKWKNINDMEKIMYQEKARVEKELTRTRIGEKSLKLSSKTPIAKQNIGEHKLTKPQDNWNRTEHSNYNNFENLFTSFKLENSLDPKLEELDLRIKLEPNNLAGQTFTSEATTAHSEGVKNEYRTLEVTPYNPLIPNFRYPTQNQIVLNGIPLREDDLNDEGGKHLLHLRNQTVKKAQELLFDLLNFNLPSESFLPPLRSNPNFFASSLPNDGFINSISKNTTALSQQAALNNVIVNSLKLENSSIKEENGNILMQVESLLDPTSKE